MLVQLKLSFHIFPNSISFSWLTSWSLSTSNSISANSFHNLKLSKDFTFPI
jgi:hypothetical protein